MFNLRAFFRKAQVEQELDDELRFHLEQQIEQNVAKGMSAEEARYAALRTFGGIEQVKEECRDSWGVRFIEELVQDIRYGLRQLRRNPGFTVVAIAMLALGIGVNSAIFSMVSAIYLAAPNVRDADRVAVVSSSLSKYKSSTAPVSSADFTDWRAQNNVFSDMAACSAAEDMDLVANGVPVDVGGMRVSANYFHLLGIGPALGREFLRGPDEAAHANEVILSDGIWRQHFGANPRIVGSPVTINGKSYTVIGIMPQHFSLWAGPSMWYGGAQLWIPLTGPPSRDSRPLLVFGRLKPGVSTEQASAEMATIASRLAHEYPKADKGWTTTVLSLRDYRARGLSGLGSWLGIMMAAVGLVLLIACANLAGLLLARTASRRQELAIRAALGAGRGRLVRQLLSEALALVISGGAAGLFLAWCGTCLLRSWMSFSAGSQSLPLGIDINVLSFTVAVSFLAVILSALLPALAASRAHPEAALRSGSRIGKAVPHARSRRILVGGEIALAVLLLAGAGVLIKSVVSMFTSGYGFNDKDIWNLGVNLNTAGFKDPASRVRFFETAAQRVAALPGVASASATRGLPLTGENSVPFSVTSSPPEDNNNTPQASYYQIGPGYFHTLQIPLLRGRVFTDQDQVDSAPVAIINQALARHFFAGQDAIGRYIYIGNTSFVTLEGSIEHKSDLVARRQIVGIVGNVDEWLGQTRPGPQVYVPMQQSSISEGGIAVRWQGGGAPSGAELVKAVWSGNSQQIIVTYPASMSRLIDKLGGGEAKLIAKLMGTFALCALLLAAIGLYGVISYLVTQRTHEIGVRMALGARRKDVFRLILREAVLLGACGLAAGLILAAAVPRVLGSVFFGLSTLPASVLAGVAAVMAIVILLASYIPARHATKVDPMVALRYE